MSKASDVLVFGMAALWCAVIFGIYAWPAWQQGFDATALIVVDPYSDFSDKSSWLPLAMEVAKGRLFPLTSTAGNVINGLSFYPYLSLWLLGLLIALLGPGTALAVSQVVFPTAVFILSALTFRLYLPRRWALMLAALGAMAYSRYPLRDFIMEIAAGSGWRQLGTVFRPDLANVPFPAISALAFVGIFYLTMRHQRLSGRWIAVLSVGWALQTQVHLVNALFGIPFWLTYLLLRLWRQRRNDGNDIAGVWRIWAGQMVITALVSAPALAGLAGPNSGLGPAELFGGAGSASRIPSGFYFAAYFILPIAVTTLVAVVRRIDPFEILTRFWPIILFMLLELMLALLLPLFDGSGALTELIFSRIGIFFLHMLYFVPLIHYAVRPHAAVSFSSGIEANPLAAFLRRCLRWLLNDASLIYLPLLFVVLTQFAVASAEQAVEFQKQRRAPAVKAVEARLALLARFRDRNGMSVADEYLATNLNLHLRGYASLINNRFANQISVNDALERMGLYAHAVGWDEAEFLRFMLPEEGYRGSHWDEVLDWTNASSVSGLGYWLVFHQHHVSENERRELEVQLRRLFVTIDPALVAKRVALTYVLSTREPPAVLHPSTMAVTPYGTLYQLNTAKVDR